MTIACQNPEAVARRAFYLAYEASRPVGMGFLQARDGVTENQVCENVFGAKENPTEGHADYVYGRMMKLSLRWDKSGIVENVSEPRSDYQSWCNKYPTYNSLITAAIESLEGR